jgi:hypothetical protein
MGGRWNLIAVVAVAAAINLGCQQLDRRSNCGSVPDCGCTATAAGCHCGSGQPACGAESNAAPVPPMSPATEGRYEDVPQKPPMAAPPERRTAPPPPVDDARAPRPLNFQ